jgi:hypothetical protein
MAMPIAPCKRLFTYVQLLPILQSPCHHDYVIPGLQMIQK